MCISGRLDGWPWKELHALPARWFDILASVLCLFDSEEVWPGKLFDECIVMIPEAGGDATRLGQRLLNILLAVYWLCASVRLCH